MLNYDMKTGSAARIRKAMLIIGIFATICLFFGHGLHIAGITSYETPQLDPEKRNSWMKLPRTIIEVGRWTTVVGLFLALAVAGLLIAHCLMQYLKINKTNVKNELTTNVINTIVGLVILSFVIYSLTFVFNKDKWSFVEKDGYVTIGSPLIAEKTHLAFVSMGILFATTLYATIFAGAYNRPGIVGKETNIKTFRTNAIFMFSIVMIGLVAITAVISGGFRNMTDILKKVVEAEPFKDDWNKYYSQYFETTASIYETKFLLGVVGSVALIALSQIPCGILGLVEKKEKNKVIIVYSIMGGLTLVFFIVAAAMIKMENLSKTELPKWMTDTSTVTAMTLVSYVLALITGCVAFGTTHKLEPKVKKAVATQPAA